MAIKINNNGIKKLMDNAERLHGKQSVTLDVLLNPGFLSKHTTFGSLNEMFESSKFSFKNEEEFKNINQEELDSFINSNTDFESWDDMIKKAGAEHISTQLSKGL